MLILALQETRLTEENTLDFTQTTGFLIKTNKRMCENTLPGSCVCSIRNFVTFITDVQLVNSRLITMCK